MQLTDDQRQLLDRLANPDPGHYGIVMEVSAAIGAALTALDARAAEIERLRSEAMALRSEVAALGARIARAEARARAWEYLEGED